MLDQIIEKLGMVIHLDKNLVVDAERFAALFSECQNLTYAELKRVDEEKGYGYGPYIEKWKEQGLIE